MLFTSSQVSIRNTWWTVDSGLDFIYGEYQPFHKHWWVVVVHWVICRLIYLDSLQRDKSLKFHFAKKVVFVPIPTISVLHAIQEQFNRFSFILVHDLEDSSASSLSPRKLAKVKKWKEKTFCHLQIPCTFHSSKLYKVKKKIAGVSFCHLFQKF